EAIRYGASAVICVHNHPSGDVSPSASDIRVTRTLRESAKIIGIDFLDHVIVPSNSGSDPQHYSFQGAGMI
ncbi:MAG: JAB domain-containing protein, partial [Verrucomicrobiota bacterium]